MDLQDECDSQSKQLHLGRPVRVFGARLRVCSVMKPVAQVAVVAELDLIEEEIEVATLGRTVASI